MKRIFVALLSVCLLVGLTVSFAAPVTAAGKETIVIAGSDFQVDGNKTDKVESLISTLEIYGITKVDCAFFCGDYTLDAMESNKSQYGIQKLKDTFSALTGGNMLFAQGNHDIETTTGLSRAGDNDPASKAYGVFIIHEDQYREWGNNRADTEKMVGTLRSYLEQKHRQGWNKPVFILNHIPLHWSNRTLKDGSGTDADLIFDALNEYGEKGLNILYLYGHNHSGGYDDFMGGGAVYLKKGDTMEVCHGNKREHKTRTLNFTYMNAGFIGYYSTTEKTTDNAVSMSVFRIQEDGSVIVTRYDTMGIHDLKSKGVWHPDWNKEGYNATPNTLVYASSRKVTATSDVAVDTPLPPPTEATIATTTEYTTTTRYGGVVITKPTGTTTTAEDADVTTVSSEDGSVTTHPTEAEDTADTTKKQNTADVDTAAPLIPWWAWLGMSIVALLLIGAVITIILLSRPVK